MDWIKCYRENTDFFLNDEKYKEVYRFILNHDHIFDKVSINRDIKISNILDEKYDDQLNYLNPIIDNLKDKIHKTIQSPNAMITYLDIEDGKTKTKWVTTKREKFKNLKELSRFVDSKIEEGYKFYPFQVLEVKNDLMLRASFEF